MPLVTTKDMLLDAQNRGYAVGAFNANNLEMAQGIIMAAEEENAPVIVQVSHGAAEYAGIEEMAAIIKVLANKTSIPVALHLDHGMNYVINMLCLRAGFTSLMFDGSQLSFEDNIRITREVINAAHAIGVPVEAELGKVPKDPNEVKIEDLHKFMTKPEEAQEFVEKTNVDSLAIAVGSVHKMKIQKAQLDIERIKKIREIVSVPLVLHGASGVTDEAVRQAIKAGICKVNVHTHLAKAFTKKIREILINKEDIADLRKYMDQGRQALAEEVKNKIHLFGANGKASGIKYSEVKTEEYLNVNIVELSENRYTERLHKSGKIH